MIDIRHNLMKLALGSLTMSGMNRFGPALRHGHVPVLMLHRVTNRATSPLGVNAHLSITPQFLDTLLTRMKRDGYRFLAMNQLCAGIETPWSNPKRREKLAAVTLDDGYVDTIRDALPVFRKHDVPFTVYVAPGLLDGRADLWWEVLEHAIARRPSFMVGTSTGQERITCETPSQKRAAYHRMLNWLIDEVPEAEIVPFVRRLAMEAEINGLDYTQTELMDWQAVRALASDPLCTIGAHTTHHRHLARLSESDALAEMAHSIDAIALETGKPPRHLAYPYGYAKAVGRREVALASQLPIDGAVTTRHGFVTPQHGTIKAALPRISVNGRFQRMIYMRALLSGWPLWAMRGNAIATV
jgi:peptidoglycan/xylan/chitin deacetylase (PgdA/CDA1 family)